MGVRELGAVGHWDRKDAEAAPRGGLKRPVRRENLRLQDTLLTHDTPGWRRLDEVGHRSAAVDSEVFGPHHLPAEEPKPIHMPEVGVGEAQRCCTRGEET